MVRASTVLCGSTGVNPPDFGADFVSSGGGGGSSGRVLDGQFSFIAPEEAEKEERRGTKRPAVTSMSAMNLPSEGGSKTFDRAYLYRNSSVNDLRRLENLSCMLGQEERVDGNSYEDNDNGVGGNGSGGSYYFDGAGDGASDGGSLTRSASSMSSFNNGNGRFRAKGLVYKRKDGGNGGGGDGTASATTAAATTTTAAAATSPKIYRERYVIGRVIGEGSYAKVKEAFDLNNHCTVAIKVFSLQKLRRIPLGESSMARELRTFRRLVPHHNVVSLVDYWRDEAKDKNYLAMTYVPCGTLKSLIDRAPDHRVPLPQARRLFLCIVQGLAHLHAQGIYHRDLKTDNFMLMSEFHLCITDFGTATFDSSTDGIGAPAFQPPEVALTGRAPSSAKLDIWAAGITLFVMTTGHYPFDDSGTVYQLFEDIGRCHIEFPADLPQDLLDLLRGMLRPDPAQRMSLDEIAASPWLRRVEECTAPVPAPPIRTVFTTSYVQQLVNPDGISLQGSGPGDLSALLNETKRKNTKCCTIL